MSVTAVIVLAAGKGTRMKSDRPKVLHSLAGQPMVFYAIDAALALGAAQVVLVVGHGRVAIEESVQIRYDARVDIAVQHEQQGTAHAVRAALPSLRPDITHVLVTYGDAPLVPVALLEALCAPVVTHGEAMSLATAEVDSPRGYGRILGDATHVRDIREEKDCTEAERLIRVINAGVYCFERAFLEREIQAIGNANKQNEFYLTDIVRRANGKARNVAWNALDCTGINDRAELLRVERVMYERIAERWAREGVTVHPNAQIDASVVIEPDAEIGSNVHLRGHTVVGARAQIDVGTVVTNSHVHAGAMVLPYCVIADSVVEKGAKLGPFAHLRPKSHVGQNAHVGNFVELKNTTMHAGAKANHLAYLGDGDVGSGANIGAGTIFCNYDGFQKHRTTIEPNAFVGSNSSLVAPVTIGEGAYVGSGSVITTNVPAQALGVARARQENKLGYAEKIRALKKKK